jgi:maltose-binding protein MalE
VELKYSSSENYEQQIVIDTQAGSPPDVAILPQPGLIADLAAKGLLTPLGDETKQWLLDNYAAGQSWVDLSTYNGKDGTSALYAFPYKIDVKSLVWYVPENFEDAGYEVPKTMEELKALTGEDRRRRRKAVVHRSRFGRRDRLAGDRLGRGPDAADPARRDLRQMGEERDTLHGCGGHGCTGGVRLVRAQ